MTDEKEEAEALAQLGAAMKRWGVKPDQLGPAFRELMAFTPDEVLPMTDEPKPLTDAELDELRMLARGSDRFGDRGDELLDRLVAEVRRLREQVRSVEVTVFGDPRRRLLCLACNQERDDGPMDPVEERDQ